MNRQKKTRGFAVFASLFLLGLTNCEKKEQNKIFTVCINKIVDHAALDETVRGLQETLQKAIPCRVIIESAQGNALLAQQITAKFVGQKPDVIVGIGTVAAQTFLKYKLTGKTRFIFSSITDPVAAGLQKPGLSGVSNFIDLEPQLELFLALCPSLKRLGIVYNPSEVNSVTLNAKWAEVLKNKGLQLVLAAATKPLDVPQAVTTLVRKCDAIFVSNDNTALSAFKNIVTIANQDKDPVFVSDTDIVYKGAVAALGPNQYEIGVQTAQLILDLRTAPATESRIEYPKEIKTVVNCSAAKLNGITIPDDVLKTAEVLP
jgi:putative ABC transport system substrate-binding protein